MSRHPAPAAPVFHPTVRRWFETHFDGATPPQSEGWPAIAAGRHTLIAAPTGTGKTLAAFLWALDGLLRQGDALEDATQVLYVSPLRALSNDVQKNLDQPLAQLRAMDPDLPDVRVLVRTGDTPASQRASMVRRPPHILVTTPESLYILLTSKSGRAMLSTVRTVIVDEIHALSRDKRGSHLALSLERLEALTDEHARESDGPGAGVPLQRIGLSATQKPLETVSRLLVGTGRECTLVDTGHLRTLDVGVEVTESPLSAVCSHEQWGEIYERMARLVFEHRTTLVFVNTRKLAERLSARLTETLSRAPDDGSRPALDGEAVVACHHGSLSREMRLDAEQRLKAGSLRVLVATASLELGIDIGDVDLVIQVGSPRSVATLLQRVGRAGHGVNRVPKGRLFPLTMDELAEGAALMMALEQGLLDRTPTPPAALDILAQQIVAACVGGEWQADELFDCLRRAWPYRELPREHFDEVVALHTEGRWAMLHLDGVAGRIMATKRARIPALTCGGAIPDNADYRVELEPEGTFVGTLNEDFAVEANVNDIFQLGNTSWRILKVEPGVVRVADAKGEPPTLPFWLGEAPARTAELSELVGQVREQCTGTAWLAEQAGLEEGAAVQLAEYLEAGRSVLGAVPTQNRVVAERFFDETGGMQLVVHAPFGGRINKAWGLALRKCFCRGFGFELQAAATEDSLLISLGPHHSFPVADVFGYLHSKTARHAAQQAVLATPLFTSRWRWNVTRSLMLPRFRNGKPVPPALLRMRADDLLVQAFPDVMACGENLPAGDLTVPDDHPIVRQTVEDALSEALDADGLVELLQALEAGDIETVAVDLPEPSVFAHGILAAQPYAFLDDAPLEERRTQAVRTRRTLSPRDADELGALDPAAVDRVKEEAWPLPGNVEEVHEMLLWMGFLTEAEGRPHQRWIDELVAAGRVRREEDRWYATEAPREGKAVLAGRLEALGPVPVDDPMFAECKVEIAELQADGGVLQTRIDGRDVYCNRRLLARIHRYTLDKLRQEIEPVSAATYLRFLLRWQHVEPGQQSHGPEGVLQVIRQLAGFEAPAAAWENDILPARVKSYRRGWLDELTLTGQVAWGRLWGTGTGAIRTVPVALFPRDDFDAWRGLAVPGDIWSLKGSAKAVHEVLQARGACFSQEIEKAASLLPSQLEQGLAELIGLGLATCDAFGGLRRLLRPGLYAKRRRLAAASMGRWSLFRHDVTEPPSADFVARQLLRRTGVVFRRVLERERQPVPWRDLLRVLRTMEARGEVRGGRFVAGFPGEQYALSEAVTMLRKLRREPGSDPLSVAAADPLNLRGILTPDERVASNARQSVLVI